MKKLTIGIKQLAIVSMLLMASVANAGLITTELDSSNATLSESGRSFSHMLGGQLPYEFAISGRSHLFKDEWAQMSWQIDTTNLIYLSFNLLFENQDYGNASVSFGDTTLKLESQIIDFDTALFSGFANSKQFLTFQITATNNLSSRDDRHNRPRLVFGDINLSYETNSNISVPEPSSIALMLLALTVIFRKQLIQSFAAYAKQK